MSWVENHPFKMAFLASLFIAGFATLFHKIHYTPNDWSTFLIYLPFYVCPTFTIAGLSHLSKRGKKK